jgi:uncharacterized membrane protein
MRTAISIFLTLAVVAMCGCQSSSPKGGSVVKGEGFSIAVPTFNTNIKQGEVQNVSITVERGNYFKQDVKLRISAPKGLTAEPAKLTIKASESPAVQIRVSAAKDAALSEYPINIVATPTTGEPTSIAFTVKVVAPDAGYTIQSDSPQGGSVAKGEGFKIAAPTFATKIAQGETQTVAISLERGDSFKKDVTLRIKLAKGAGLAFDPAKVLVKASDKADVQIQVSAASDAAISDYTVSVTGTPETGQPTATEFTVKVVAP